MPVCAVNLKAALINMEVGLECLLIGCAGFGRVGKGKVLLNITFFLVLRVVLFGLKFYAWDFEILFQEYLQFNAT